MAIEIQVARKKIFHKMPKNEMDFNFVRSLRQMEHRKLSLGDPQLPRKP